MTQLEIATRIFCSGKAETLELAYKLAGELMALEKPKGNFTSNKPLGYEPSEDELEALKERTAKRTQQLFDLGFEWNEEHQSFEQGECMIIPSAIENFNNYDWEYILNEFEVEEGKEEDNSFKLPTDYVEIKDIIAIKDIFNGKPYIEFEMDNSICRLYKLSDGLEEKNFAEQDLTTKTGKVYIHKNIMSSGENKEHELGITIYKK